MVLSLSTQGYQSILLSVSMHQNEPVNASDMLPFFHPSSSSLPLYPVLLICFFLSPPLLSADCCRCLSLLTFTPPPPSPGSVRNIRMDPIQIISGRERERERGTTRRCQWQFNPRGARCTGEQGVRNAARVPGIRLIAFGFVQIWLPLRGKRK